MLLELITDEVIARQTPEAQGIIRALLAELEARDQRWTARVETLTARRHRWRC